MPDPTADRVAETARMTARSFRMFERTFDDIGLDAWARKAAEMARFHESLADDYGEETAVGAPPPFDTAYAIVKVPKR